MKVAICTLGCKVNQYETQALEQELLHRGHELVDFEETADAYVVNTCSVTAVSDKKSRQMLRQAQRRNPSAVIRLRLLRADASRGRQKARARRHRRHE